MKFSGFNTTEKIGIGTNDPGRPLHVRGAGNSSVVRVGDGDTDGAAAIAYIEFGANSTSWNRHSYVGSAGADSHLWIVNEENADILFYANNAEKMVIKNDGNVGINTTAPSAILHIRSSGTARNVFYVAASDNGHLAGIYEESDGRGALNVRNAGGTATINLDSGGNSYFTGGNFGIGTTAPGSLLTISGNSDDGDDASALRIIDEDSTGGSKLPAIMFYGGSTIQGRIRGGDGTFAIAVGSTPTTALSIDTSTRKLTLDTYGSGTHTGTSAYKLSVDSSGNIIETSIGSGAVDGAGTTNYISKWTDGDTIGNSSIHEAGAGSLQIEGPSAGRFLTLNAPTTGGYITFETADTAFADIGTPKAISGIATYSTTDLMINVRSGAKNIVFGMNGYEKVRIDSNGKVGIGTNAPGAPLEVVGGSTNNNDTANVLALTGSEHIRAIIDTSSTAGHQASLVLESNSNEVSIATTGSNEMRFNAGGSERVRIISDGNVGIGTTVPAATLHVSKSSNAAVRLTRTSTDGQVLWFYRGSTASGNVIVKSTGLGLGGGTSENSIFIKTDGNVGIGITNPDSLLHIEDDYSLTKHLLHVKGGGSSGAYGVLVETANGTDLFKIDTLSYKVSIPSGYPVGIGTPDPAALLHIQHATAPNIRIERTTGATSGSLGLIEFGARSVDDNLVTIYAEQDGATDAGKLTFSTEATGGALTARMTIKSDGKVGIGTAVPATTLDVNGITTFRDYLKIGAAGVHGVITWGGGLANTVNFIGASGKNLSLGTDGAYDKLVIKTDGKIGIGTTDPKYDLQVNGDIALGPQGASTTKTICSARSDGGSSNRAAIRFVTNSNNDESLSFDVLDSGVAGHPDALKIDYTGKVGIGTTAPATPLHVWSTSYPQFRVSYNSALYFTLDHAATLNVYGNDWYVRLNGSEKFRIKQDGKIGIGTNNPLNILTLHQAAGANIRFQNATTGRYFIVGEGVGANDKFSFRGNSYRSTDTLTVDFPNNRVGVANISPSYSLDVSGTFRSTGAAYFNGAAYTTGQAYNGGLRIGGAGGSSYAFAGERLFTIPTFPNGVANQKVDLYWTGAFWGYMEIEITGSYTNQNMSGVLTKSFALGLNASNAIYTNESWYSNLGGLTYGNFAISDVTWDSTNSRYRIQIVHRVSTGNQLILKMRCLGASSSVVDTFMSGTTVGSIYTTDTTVFGPPVKELAAPNDSVWLNGGYLGIGVAAPTQLLEVYQVGNSGNSYFNGGIKVGGSTSTLGGFIGYNSSASGYFNITNLNNTGGANARIQFGFGGATDGTPATQVMTLNQAGNVGIGTTVPGHPLVVVTPTGDKGISLTNSSNVELIHMRQEAGDSGAIGLKDGGNVQVWLTSRPSSNSYFNVSGAKFGIGTNGPSKKLHVSGTTGDNSRIRITDTTNSTNFDIGTDASGGFFSAIEDKHILFYTNGSEKVRIENDGNVGIGSATPIRQLDVLGAVAGQYSAALINTSATGHGLYIKAAPNSASYMALAVDDKDGATILVARGDKRVGIGTNAPGGILSIGSSNESYFSSNAPNTLNFFYNTNSDTGGWINYRGYQDGTTQTRDLIIGDGKGNKVATFDGSTKRVGIGTDVPSTKLQVNDTSDSRLLIYETGASPYTATLELASQAVGTYGALIQYTSGAERLTIQNYGRTASNNSNMGGIAFKTKLNNTTPTEVMSIHGFSGNVGIGDITPSYKLDVNGTFRVTGAATFDSSIGFATVLAGNGTASLPSFAFTNDPNTGMYNDGANDNLKFSTGGVVRAFLTATQWNVSGNIVGVAGIFSGAVSGTTATFTDVMNLSGVNKIHQLSGHNFVQGDATMTYLYGGSGGGQIRTTNNASSLVQWLDNGNVGIGTTSPSSQFHVYDGTAVDAFKVENYNRGAVWNSVGAGGMYSEYQLTGTWKFRLGQANHLVSGASVNNFALSYAGDLLFSSSVTERMRITSTGKVGIGRTDPSTKLVVNGIFDASATPSVSAPAANSANKGILITREAASGWGTGYTYGIDFGVSNSINAASQYKVAAIYGAVESVPYYIAGKLGFYTTTGGNGALLEERMTIRASGSVGIGTTDPGQKLHVNGNILVNAQILTPGGSNLQLNPNTGLVTVGGALTATGNITGGAFGPIVFTSSTQSIKWPNTSGQSGSRSWGWIGEQGAYGYFQLYRSDASDGTLDTEVMRFRNTGNAEFRNEVTIDGNFNFNGNGTFGTGANGAGNSGSIPAVSHYLRGYSVQYNTGGSGARLTNTGFLTWWTGAGWTSNERMWSFTNAYNMSGSGGPRFALLKGSNNTTIPTLGDNGALGTNTSEVCYWDKDGVFKQNGDINLTGDIGVENGRGVRGPSATEQLILNTTDGIKLTSGGTERVRIETDGNVGIGTTNPGDLLHIYGTRPTIRLQGGSGLWMMRSDDNQSHRFEILDANGGYDKFAIYPGNTGAIVLHSDGAGCVGIGTTAPGGKLHVYGLNNSAGDLWTVVGTGNTPNITIQNASATDNTNAALLFKNDSVYVGGIGMRFTNHSSDAAQMRFSTCTGGNTRERMILDESGNLTLGTSAGTGLYDLYADDVYVGGGLFADQYIYHIGDTNTQIRFESSQITIGTSGGSTISLNNDENIYFYSDSTEVVRFSDNNASDPQVQAANGKATRPSYSFFNDVDLGMYRDGADILRFSTAGVARLSVIANGNVGIGTDTPETPFHVYDNNSTQSMWKFQNYGTGMSQLSVYQGSGNLYLSLNRTDTYGSISMATQPFYIKHYHGSWVDTFSINTSGQVGINDSNASYMLDVNGTFRATDDGYFDQDLSVAANFSVSGSKNFVIDHPTKEGMKLVHSCIEGPEIAVYHRGRAQSDTITLPDYWSGLVRDGTITVQLTPNGSFQHLYVVSTSLSEIKIGAAEGETIDCYYTIYGERADLDPLVVEKIV